MEMSLEELFGSEYVYRSRRSHKKSRNGCLACKKRRKKCDELKPSCTRCANGNISCQYPCQDRCKRHPSRPRHLSPLCPWGNTPSFGTPFSSSSTSSPLPIETSSPSSSSALVYDLSPSLSSLWMIGRVSLDSVELDLLSHYLSHTSRVVAFDNDDLYALHAGFPALAFYNRTLMNSILALAAVCKCHDIMVQQSVGLTSHNRDQILELLVRAEHFHKESLHQTQIDIGSIDKYDCIIANAPLMVLYGSANHAVRIKLAEMADGKSELLPADFVPTQSQWIVLIRAAHLAYTGILQDQVDVSEPAYWTCSDALSTPGLLTPESPLSSPEPASPTISVLSPQDGPTKQTKQLLFPILAATSGPALAKLRSRACALPTSAEAPETSDFDHEQQQQQHQQPTDDHTTTLQACFAALDVLEDIAADVFNTGGPNNKKKTASLSPLSRLSGISPWLRDYLARVTMATPTQPIRRTITAFVNRVPAPYLRVVQEVLDLLPPSCSHDRDLDDSAATSSSSKSSINSGLSAPQRLVMDIYAHWLVLVMLLDGVWWLGGIGAWELGRIVALVGDRGWLEGPLEEVERWWPASMYNIGTELKRQGSDE